MTDDDYLALDATAMAAAVAAHEVTPAELHEAATQHHHRTSGHIAAVVEWYEQPNLGHGSGPLAGVPFLRKDYGSAEAGRLVEMGSRLAAGVVSPRTDPYFQRLRAAGATMCGRTTVPELIQHGTTENQVTGVTRNPHNLAFSAGGSSGGAAAAVAAGVVPAAHASDCAGSIRIPAATNGLIGLKPSRRRVPWPSGGWGGIAEEFVVTRTIRDAQRFWSVLADRPTPSPRVGALRIGLSTGHWSGHAADPVVVGAAEAVARRLEVLGHTVVPVDGCPVDYGQLMATWHGLFSRWVAHDVAWLVKQTGRSPDADHLEPMTRHVVDRVARLTVAEVNQAQVDQGRVSFDLDSAMAELDLLLTPALGRAGIPLDWVGGDVADLSTYIERNDELFVYCYLANVTGRPALVVPSGEANEDGLPQGVQLLGRWGDDERLLAVADQLGAEGVAPVRFVP